MPYTMFSWSGHKKVARTHTRRHLASKLQHCVKTSIQSFIRTSYKTSRITSHVIRRHNKVIWADSFPVKRFSSSKERHVGLRTGITFSSLFSYYGKSCIFFFANPYVSNSLLWAQLPDGLKNQPQGVSQVTATHFFSSKTQWNPTKASWLQMMAMQRLG